MRYKPVPVVGGFYSDETRPWSVQDCLNYLPTQAEVAGTRTPATLKTPPGLKPYLSLGALPIRGTFNAVGNFFVVAGTTLYQIAPDGTTTVIGTIPGVGRVVMSNNQLASAGYQLIVVNGSAGYVYDSSNKTFQKITDAGYPGAINAVFLGGYLVQIEPGRRFAFNSAPADALSYNTIDRFTSEVSPDLLVSMAVSNNELILFSENSTEFFDVTDNPEQPIRTKQITMSRGCAGRYTVVNMDNTVYWLGDDGVFYRLAGYTPQRISTRPIEEAIRGHNWGEAYAFTWESGGYKVAYWTFPDGYTFGFDVSSGLWHRRASYGLNRWRPSTMTTWNGEIYAGDFQAGKLWQLAWDYVLEGDQPFISERTMGPVSDNQNRVLVNRLELIMQVGELSNLPAETIVPLSLTGHLPNGKIGEVVSYQYTTSGGWPPYGPVTLISGALPAGLSINAAGLVTGTITASGTFSWELSVTDSHGQIATLNDSASVTVVTWWLTTGGTPPAPNTSQVWISEDPRVWPNAPVLRSPYTIVSNYGVKWLNGSFALVVGPGTSSERTTTLDGTAGITTTQVTIGAQIERLFGNGTVSVASIHSSKYWYTSVDDGQTWQAQNDGSSDYMHSVVQMKSGRWVAYREMSSSEHLVYSDQAIPTAFQNGSPSNISPNIGYYPIAVGPNYAVIMSIFGGCYKTTDGISWVDLSNHDNILGDCRDGATNGNTIIFAGQPGTSGLYRSTDAGVSWSAPSGVPLKTFTRIEFDNGFWVAQCVNQKLYVSVDDGATFAESVTPSIGGGAAWMASSLEYTP